MKIIFESYVSIFIICMCAVLCACLISADMDVANARDAYTTYMCQLQDSNFAPAVVSACREDAEMRGYKIEIETYDDGTGNRSGRINLSYTYTIKIIGYSTTRYVRGYVS